MIFLVKVFDMSISFKDLGVRLFHHWSDEIFTPIVGWMHHIGFTWFKKEHFHHWFMKGAKNMNVSC